MLIVLSPAKSLDYDSPVATRKHSMPELLDEAAELVELMKSTPPAEIERLMEISPELAELNFERFQNWERPFTIDNARAALLTFKGDTYLGMDAAATFTERDYTQAQKSVRILSGLYGVLRPLDLMQPYRLEMGTKLKNPSGTNLYAFWGDRITEVLGRAVEAGPGPRALINLASKEYFSSVRPRQLDVPVITPSFLDEKHGDYRTISFFAKRARGAMAGWVVRERVKTLKGLRSFDALGYRYDPLRSSDRAPVFVRSQADLAGATAA